jgi:multiple sugar transport system substrate-binding protein
MPANTHSASTRGTGRDAAPGPLGVLAPKVAAAMLAAALTIPLVGTAVSAQDDAFDPMRYAGCTVNIAMVAGERDELGLQDLESDIEAETGINIELTTLEQNTLIESIDQNLRADESAFDIMHILGFSVAGTVGAGLFEELTDYVADPSRVPADYDFADFPPGVLEYQGYFDVENGEFGGDDLYLIPGIHSGSVLLFYRQDLLDAAGVAVPTTWAEYLAAAEALTTEDIAGSAMIGANDVSGMLVDWYTRFITMGGEMASGSKADGTLEVNLDSPEGVAALQNMIDVLPFSPAGVTQYGFTEALDAFAVGKVAMWPAWSTIAGGLYGEDSLVADSVAVAAMPADDGNPRGIRGGWGLGIPANLSQEQKDCAFHILTYITSSEFEKHQVLNYQTDPNRSSTGADAAIAEALPFVPVGVAATESAQILEIANIPETFEIVGAIAREINLALTGAQDAEAAMAAAQAAATAILQRAGHQAG